MEPRLIDELARAIVGQMASPVRPLRLASKLRFSCDWLPGPGLWRLCVYADMNDGKIYAAAVGLEQRPILEHRGKLSLDIKLRRRIADHMATESQK